MRRQRALEISVTAHNRERLTGGVLNQPSEIAPVALSSKPGRGSIRLSVSVESAKGLPANGVAT
jgi:hypothetical protein